jgi:predicted transcriptional regulator
MQVNFTPEQLARLEKAAAAANTDVEQFVRTAALTVSEQDEHFRAAVLEGIADADRDEFLDEGEMDARIKKLLQS